MATGTGRDEDVDPAADGRADYDYRSDAVERPDLEAALDRRTEGEVRFDDYSRALYATDASIYERTPVGVVFPRSTGDVAAVVEYCAAEEIPVLPRGGGTSLAGQAVNEAVVLDFTRHMDDLVAVDPEDRTATARPGLVLGDLNAAVADHGLTFAPDPAWGDKSALGGAIGNNSTGAHSLLYGKTDAYVESCEVVLADGTVTTFGEVSTAELRERADPTGDLEERIHAAVARVIDEDADLIAERYPDLHRNVSGYNLDRLIEEARSGRVNLARLLAGSEGTLAVVTAATVSLEPLPGAKSMALLAYDDLAAATADVAAITEHGPAAVEVLDDVLLELARETPEFAEVAATVPDGASAALIVEFYADSAESSKRAVADLLADRLPDAKPAVAPCPPDERVSVDEPVRAFDAVQAYAAADRDQIWKLRKSGLPILLSRTTDEKHHAFVEDLAVPPDRLPEYVEGFREILDRHDATASFYGHAGPGVLHVRPLVNPATEAGRDEMTAIADEATDLVVDLGGSVSGEHGDGRARTRWNRKLYGEEVVATFRDLKSAFDPDWLLNPGQVCGDVSTTEDLRFPEEGVDPGFEPVLDWSDDDGVAGMVELCHGCGGCRGDQATTGGVMCPTYRATEEEITSTRGRANALREAMSGDLPAADHLTEEFATEVLDLCVGCKGCAVDCPSGVDLAKLKAEVTHARHRREGASTRAKLFANVRILAKLGSLTAPVSNRLPELPGARRALEATLGVASERTLPTFRRETFRDWFDSRGGPAVSREAADCRVLLVADPFTNYTRPVVGQATVRVLEAAGVHVRLAAVGDTGRPAFSKGFLERARETARENVATLAPRVREGWDVVALEPSDAVMLQADYRDLLSGDDVDAVAAGTYGVCEYVDVHRLDEGVAFDAPGEALTYHGHCHQKAARTDHHAVGVLRRAGYAVDPLDSGCCGMAGSFGYEAEHYSMSRAIASVLFDQIDESDGERVVTPGASCRTQIADRDGRSGAPPTPVEALARALAET